MLLNIKKILNNRKILGGIIIALSLVVAGRLIWGGNLEINSSENKNFPITKKQKKSDNFSLTKDGEKLGVVDVEDLSKFFMAQSEKLNLTEEFANRIAGKISNVNTGKEDLLTSGDGIFVPDNEEIITEAINTYGNEFIVDEEPVKLEELKISSDNSTEGIIAYYSNLKEIVSKYRNIANPLENLSDFSVMLNTTYVLPIIQGLDGLIAEMKILKVPSDFLLIHKRIIDIYIAEKSIFGVVVFANEDPLRASVAISALLTVEEKFKDLQEDLATEMKRHGILVEIK